MVCKCPTCVKRLPRKHFVFMVNQHESSMLLNLLAMTAARYEWFATGVTDTSYKFETQTPENIPEHMRKIYKEMSKEVAELRHRLIDYDENKCDKVDPLDFFEED